MSRHPVCNTFRPGFDGRCSRCSNPRAPHYAETNTPAPDATATRQAALAALREGRVAILGCQLPIYRGGVLRPSAVVAQVRGHEATHDVELHNGTWTCSCSTRSVCAHQYAVQLITRHSPQEDT